eukprot:6415190-Lingulodinium_polyedra.AAC.1
MDLAKDQVSMNVQEAFALEDVALAKLDGYETVASGNAPMEVSVPPRVALRAMGGGGADAGSGPG